MQALAGILSVTFPFFALVLCGYLAARSRLLPLDAVPGLNMFVLYFALPCMLWRFGSTTPLPQLFNPVIAMLWLVAAALIVAGTAWLARRRGAGWPDAAMGALVAAFPNSGFMGVPLILALLGEAAVGPVMATLLVDLVVTTSLCIGLSQWGAADEHGPARAVGRALRGVLRNPMPWSILLGGLASAMGWVLPGPVDKTVAMLAGAASPVALFTIGAVLARSQMNSHERVAAVDYVPIALAKLIIHPLLVWAAGMAAIALGMPLQHDTLVVLVLLAALPSASNVSLLTERYGAHSGRVARIILVSTSLAFLSFSAAVALMT